MWSRARIERESRRQSESRTDSLRENACFLSASSTHASRVCSTVHEWHREKAEQSAVLVPANKKKRGTSTNVALTQRYIRDRVRERDGRQKRERERTRQQAQAKCAYNTTRYKEDEQWREREAGVRKKARTNEGSERKNDLPCLSCLPVSLPASHSLSFSSLLSPSLSLSFSRSVTQAEVHSGRE